jgi:hypothetical protein
MPRSLPPRAPLSTVAPTRPIDELRAMAVAARDGVIAVASALLVAFVGLLIVVYVSVSHVAFGLKSFYSSAALLTGTGLGVPDRTAMSGDMSQFLTATGNGTSASAAAGMTYSITLDLQVTVWLLPFLVLTIAYLLSRRAERKRASAEPWRVLLRALVAGFGASLGVLVLALTSHQSQTGLLPAGLDTSVPGTSELTSMLPSSGGQSELVAAFAFVGPLLLVFLASLLGRTGVWLQTPSLNRRIERARTSLALWAPAARTAWLQARIIGLLAGLVLWVRLFIAAAQDHSMSQHLGVVALAGILLFLNLSVYGAFIGFGVTVSATVGTAFSGVLANAASSGSLDSGSTGSAGSSGLDALKGASTGLGLFSEHGQWIVWLLFIAVVIGTAAPVLLSLRGRRFAVRAEDYPLRGFWRPVVLGVLGALVLVLAGRLSMGMTADFAGAGGMDVSASVNPNLLAALGLTALWFLLGYLAISFITGSPRPTGTDTDTDTDDDLLGLAPLQAAEGV